MALFASHALVRRSTMPQDIGDAYCQLPSPIMEEFHPSIRSNDRDASAELEGRTASSRPTRALRFSRSFSSLSIVRKEPLVHNTAIVEEPEPWIHSRQESDSANAVRRRLRLQNGRPSTATMPADSQDKGFWLQPVRPKTSDRKHDRSAKIDQIVTGNANVEVGFRAYITTDSSGKPQVSSSVSHTDSPAIPFKTLPSENRKTSTSPEQPQRSVGQKQSLGHRIKRRFTTMGMAVRRKPSLVTLNASPEVTRREPPLGHSGAVLQRTTSPAVTEGWALTQYEVDQYQHTSGMYASTQPGAVDGIEDEESEREDGEPLLGPDRRGIAFNNGFGQAVTPRRKRNQSRPSPVQRPPAPPSIGLSLDRPKDDDNRPVGPVALTSLTTAVAKAASEGAFAQGTVSARSDSANASGPDIDAAFAAASAIATTVADSTWQKQHSRESTIAPSDASAPSDERASIKRPVLLKSNTFAGQASTSSTAARPATSRFSKRQSMWDLVRTHSASLLPDPSAVAANSTSDSSFSSKSPAPHRDITGAVAVASVAVRNLHRSSMMVM